MSLSNEAKERNYKIKLVIHFIDIVLLVGTIVLCICSLLFKWSPLFPVITYALSYLLKIINNKIVLKEEQPKNKKSKKKKSND